MPGDFTGLRANRNHRGYPQVVAGARFPCPRAAVAGAPVGQIKLRIVRTRDPSRCAAALVGIVLRPGCIGLFRRVRRGVTTPHFLARLRVQANHETAYAELAAGHAAHHDAIGHAGCAGDGIAVFPLGDLGFPQALAGFGINGVNVRIQRRGINLAIEYRHALVVQTAAHNAGHAGIPLQCVIPELAAGADVNGDYLLDVRRVEHAVVHQRLTLLARVSTRRGRPHWHQTLDGIFVDLIQLAETLLVIPHAVGQHVVSIAAVAVAIQLLLCLRLRDTAADSQQQGCDEMLFHNPPL